MFPPTMSFNPPFALPPPLCRKGGTRWSCLAEPASKRLPFRPVRFYTQMAALKHPDPGLLLISFSCEFYSIVLRILAIGQRKLHILTEHSIIELKGVNTDG
jgi:hypothetical protein